MPKPVTKLIRHVLCCTVYVGLCVLLSGYDATVRAAEACDLSGEWQARGDMSKYPPGMSSLNLKQVKPAVARKKFLGPLDKDLTTYSITFLRLVPLGLDGGVVHYGKAMVGVVERSGYGTTVMYFKATGCRELKGSVWTLQFNDGMIEKRFDSIVYQRNE